MEVAPRDDGRESESRPAWRDPLDRPPPAVPPQGREVLFGVAHTRSRPAPKHAYAASALGEALVPPFNASRGWHIAEQPELRLGEHVLAADLAAWRGERIADLLTHALNFEVSPDWVGEVLASSTTALDRGDKLTIYRTHGVSHVWLVDPEAKTLEVLQLDGPTYRIAAVFSGDAAVRAAPFDAIELDLSILWAR
ncbi:MAG: Uma2 family endonuclease [Polyangiaceae bacterium]|nr:Uma2 family endonuclease [Polyangiaceae bacterium]